MGKKIKEISLVPVLCAGTLITEWGIDLHTVGVSRL